MQQPCTQQAYGQSSSTPSHDSGSRYPSHPGVTEFMTPGFVQRVARSYDAQPHITQDISAGRDQPAIRTGPGYDSGGAQGGGWISGRGNHAMAGSESWGTLAPQPLQNSDYSMPSVPYSNNRQPEPYYAGNHSGTEQVPGPTIGFSPHLPEAGPNQNASSGWRFHTCWVSHVEEDKIHLTIALKKS